MSLENKYSKRLLDTFPKNLGFTTNKNDPLNIISRSGGVLLTELDRIENRKIDSIFIDTCDPTEPSGVYYIDLTSDNTDIKNIRITPSGDANLCEYQIEFLQNNITGFDYIEETQPSGVTGSGILGISYGFDWDEEEYYLTIDESQYVYKYTDLEEIPILMDYVYRTQSYNQTGIDEYIQFKYEVAGEGTLPAGVLSTDIVKVAYLNEVPIEGTVIIIDVGNLSDPNNVNSDGIIVSTEDYVVDEDRIIFAPTRSNYVPAIETTVGDLIHYTYPVDYQPDDQFDSTFIVEYDYEMYDNPRCLTQTTSLHNMGLKSSPKSST